ncbi:MAG: MGMT family protein [Clostridia bacterium]|nr:MGMT family protein [Clostridia bacterium]
MNTFEKIYEAVKLIPVGRVATYAQVAIMAGNPRWTRVVGNALHKNPDPLVIPCHRVVNSKGEVSENFAFGGRMAQRKKLEKEGIVFNEKGRIDLEKFGIEI